MSEIPLKTCPFCGAEAYLHRVEASIKHPKMWKIVCIGCLNGTTGCMTREEPIKAWNMRMTDE